MISQDRLVILGSKGGPAIRPGGPSPTSTLLEMAGRRFVVDCGLGVTRGLVDAGMALKDIDCIFITHLHSDHVLELGPLVHTAWTSGLSKPVRIFGPKGTEDYWLAFLKSLEFDILLRIDDEGRPDLKELVAVHEIEPALLFDDNDIKVSALRVDHPPVTDCFALKFEAGGFSVVFSSDTAYFPPLAEFASGADVLVHEAMLADGVDRLVERTGNGARLKQHLIDSHTLASDAGRIASEAGVEHLVINHLVPADDPKIKLSDWEREIRRSWEGPLTISSDGLTIELKSNKKKEEAA